MSNRLRHSDERFSPDLNPHYPPVEGHGHPNAKHTITNIPTGELLQQWDTREAISQADEAERIEKVKAHHPPEAR